VIAGAARTAFDWTSAWSMIVEDDGQLAENAELTATSGRASLPR